MNPMPTQIQLESLQRIASAADALEAWIGRNAGQNDEWPLRLRCDSKETADTLGGMLSELALSLRPYRDSNVLEGPKAILHEIDSEKSSSNNQSSHC